VSQILTGLGVGLNAVVAEVFQVAAPKPLPAWAKSNAGVSAETESLKSAISSVASDLDSLAAKSDETSAEIFEALKYLLEDESLFDMAVVHLDEGWSAGAGYGMAVNEFAEMLAGDAAFEERIADLQDISKRVQASIAGIHMGLDLPSSGSFVIVGEDFSPADTAQFTPAVVGVITSKGGPTSHTAIICRSRSIPAVVSVTSATGIPAGTSVLVDPVGDRVVVGGTLADATKALTFTNTGRDPLVEVRANIGSLEDASAAAKTGAVGVGLFRTELLYLNESSQPSVERQRDLYASILAAAPAGPITVRTIDAGSDKPVPFLNMPEEENPALGVRGYRLIQDHRSFIEDQLKGLEAARLVTGREIWVMAPMISTVAEAAEFAALARRSGTFKVGVMVETPSIAALLPDLAGVVDFVSVGTNDLSQYLFAADRMNPSLGALLNPWQPGLIRTLERIASQAKEVGIYSSVCGESASDPAFAVLLAGLGFDSISSSRSQVDAVRAALSAVTREQAELLAQAVLSAKSAEDTKNAAVAALSAL
jgi:phosphotransferase system enzyme I (PtsI)